MVKIKLTINYELPGVRGRRAWGKKPVPSGPLGALAIIMRGNVSSVSLSREIKRSGRSLIFKTLQADDFPLRYNHI